MFYEVLSNAASSYDWERHASDLGSLIAYTLAIDKLDCEPDMSPHNNYSPL